MKAATCLAETGLRYGKWGVWVAGCGIDAERNDECFGPVARRRLQQTIEPSEPGVVS